MDIVTVVIVSKLRAVMSAPPHYQYITVTMIILTHKVVIVLMESQNGDNIRPKYMTIFISDDVEFYTATSMVLPSLIWAESDFVQSLTESGYYYGSTNYTSAKAFSD